MMIHVIKDETCKRLRNTKKKLSRKQFLSNLILKTILRIVDEIQFKHQKIANAWVLKA